MIHAVLKFMDKHQGGEEFIHAAERRQFVPGLKPENSQGSPHADDFGVQVVPDEYLAILDVYVALKNGFDLRDKAFIDGEINDVVKDRRHGLQRFAAAHQIEYMLRGMKAPGLGGHGFVDHNADAFHIPQGHGNTQLVDRGFQKLYCL
jgi:hypothetical protein